MIMNEIKLLNNMKYRGRWFFFVLCFVYKFCFFLRLIIYFYLLFVLVMFFFGIWFFGFMVGKYCVDIKLCCCVVDIWFMWWVVGNGVLVEVFL